MSNVSTQLTVSIPVAELFEDMKDLTVEVKVSITGAERENPWDGNLEIEITEDSYVKIAESHRLILAHFHPEVAKRLAAIIDDGDGDLQREAIEQAEGDALDRAELMGCDR